MVRYGLFEMVCGRMDVAVCREGGVTTYWARVGASTLDAGYRFMPLMTLAEREEVRRMRGAPALAEQTIAEYVATLLPPVVGPDLWPDAEIRVLCSAEQPCAACVKEAQRVREEVTVR